MLLKIPKDRSILKVGAWYPEGFVHKIILDPKPPLGYRFNDFLRIQKSLGHTLVFKKEGLGYLYMGEENEVL